MDPEKRPSVNEIMQIPKINQRIQERIVRDEYTLLKQWDEIVSQKLETLQAKEEELNKKEQTLREREMRI